MLLSLFLGWIYHAPALSAVMLDVWWFIWRGIWFGPYYSAWEMTRFVNFVLHIWGNYECWYVWRNHTTYCYG